MSTRARRVLSWMVFCLFSPLVAFAAPERAQGGRDNQRNDRNWVAVNIFDSIYPLTEDGTFVDALNTMETTIQAYTKRAFFRTIEQDLHLKTDPYGSRSNEGHYLMWLHFSDDFVARHPDMGNWIQPFMFMYPDQRHTDVFTAWGGQINLEALLTQGIEGLGVPTAGNYSNFTNDIVPLGEADYEGGWYMTDDQAERMLTVFNSYPGVNDGYSFVRSIAVKPNAPYEPPAAELSNGYNCGDFVFYALTTAGVVSRDTVEALKIRFWYPEAYFASPLPLKGVGSKGAAWLKKNPSSTQIPQNTMLGMAWPSLLFSNKGMEFFDKKQIAQDLSEYWYPLNYARVWDQTHVIQWLKSAADFRAKGIITELYPAIKSGIAITSPERTVAPSPKNNYVLSKSHSKMLRSGQGMSVRKLKEANLSGVEGEAFRANYEVLQGLYPAGAGVGVGVAGGRE